MAPFRSGRYSSLHGKGTVGKDFTVYKPLDMHMLHLIYFCPNMRFSFEPQFALPFTGASVMAYTL